VPPARGTAAAYPGDAGISGDPDVLFADDFESGDLKKWDRVRGPVAIDETAPKAGRYSVRMDMNRGKDTGGDTIKWFMPGADAVYLRFYVKFSRDYRYNHHFVWLGANRAADRHSSFGKAGRKPDGSYYSTSMEPWFAWGKNPFPGEVNMYSYFLDMLPDARMKDKYWGNQFFPPGPGKGAQAGAARVIPPLDEWQCWEFMIQANTPGKSDGRQAMWVDGRLVGEFSGILWRDDPDLKVNSLWMMNYGYDGGDPTRRYWGDRQSVWFDNVVVAKRYIGPMAAR
jgi:hypothetical protein